MNAIDDVPNNSLKCNFNVIVSNSKRNMRAIDWIVSAYDFCVEKKNIYMYTLHIQTAKRIRTFFNDQHKFQPNSFE